MEKGAKKITFLATFVALIIVANVLRIELGFAKITFVYVPSFLVGIFMGPIAGFMAGAIADVLGMIISPVGGAWMPLITLASGLLGFIPGAVYKWTKLKSNGIKLAISFVLCLAICTAGLNTYSLYILMSTGDTYLAFMFTRLPAQCLVAVINFVAIAILLKVKPLVKALTI